MAEFIHFEAEIDDEINISDDDEAIDDNVSEKSFIKDVKINDSRNFYRQFANVENDFDQVLSNGRNEALQGIDQFDEISNLNDDSENEMEVGDFKGSQDDVEKFNETLFPNESENQNQFCQVILLALKLKISGTKNTCNIKDFEKVIDKNLIKESNHLEKFKFIIAQQYSFNICYEINMILAKFGYFLRVYELKKKYRHLTIKKSDQQKIVRQLYSCLIEKYNGFTVVSIEYQRKERKMFEPVDIIYKPTKKVEIELLCSFSIDILKGYSSYYSKGKELRRAHKVDQCHYCNHFFVGQKRKFEIHMKNCSGKPGVIYNFNNQSLISYEDNFKSKGDIPFAVYFDFETTAPADNCLDTEQKKMFVVSYVMIVAFHPALHLDRIIIYRSFAHTLEQLSNIDYLSREQIGFIDSHLIHMLKDAASEVSKRKCKNSLGQMFSIESALVKKTLLK